MIHYFLCPFQTYSFSISCKIGLIVTDSVRIYLIVPNSLQFCAVLCDPMKQQHRLLCPMVLRKEYSSGLPCPPSRVFMTLRIEPTSYMSCCIGTGGFFTTSDLWFIWECLNFLFIVNRLAQIWNSWLIVFFFQHLEVSFHCSHGF